MIKNEQEIISSLKTYAAHNIHELAKVDDLICPIDDVSRTFVDDPESANVITDDEAKALTQYLYWDPEKGGIEDTIGEPLDQETFQKLRKIARMVIELAIQTSSEDKKSHGHLVDVADYLHPLYSRDYRTVELGFELQEYTDFFADYSQEEREDFGNKLLKEWRESKYID